jgi:uncharacterized iron-regulated membrane protein
MTGLDVLMAVAGVIVTLLVIAGMILLTPRGQVALYDEETDPQGAELSRAEAPERRATATTAS